MVEEYGSGSASAWNPRDLGAVALVGCAVWQFTSGIVQITELLGHRDGGKVLAPIVLGGAVTCALALALFFLARPIASRVLPAGAGAPAPQVLPLLSGVIAVVGLIVVVEHAYAAVRLLLPFTEYGVNEKIPLNVVAADLVIVAFGIARFARSRVLADWWARWNLRS